jgi:hypothetical protein
MSCVQKSENKVDGEENDYQQDQGFMRGVRSRTSCEERQSMAKKKKTISMMQSLSVYLCLLDNARCLMTVRERSKDLPKAYERKRPYLGEERRKRRSRGRVGDEKNGELCVSWGRQVVQWAETSMRWRDDTHTSVLVPILHFRTIIPLSKRRRKRARAERRLARWRGQRITRRCRGCAFWRADTRYIRQIRIAPDPARKVVHRPLYRLRERPWLIMRRRRSQRRGGGR